VTLAHAALVTRQLAEHPEVEEQVGYADRLVLNHADRCSPEELDAAEAALRERNALAPIVRATRAEVDLGDAFELAGAPERWAARADAGTAEPHAHSRGAATVVLRSRAPLDIHALKMWLQFLATNRSHDLWRMKGVLACRTLPNEVVVQSVHQFLELGPGEGPAPEESVLVVIGRDLDRAALERGWRSAGGETEPPPA
jgi:G3E family GTPase